MCPQCGSLDVVVEELSGRGTLYSYAVLHHPRHPRFDYPLLTALVDLDEGVRLVSNLVDVTVDGIRIGMPLEVTYVEAEDNARVPVFRPVPA
jgi:uncharacterized OB-fold protein